MTEAASLVKRLLPAAERRFVEFLLDQPLALFIERARQQMCVPRNLAMNMLEARLHQSIHEAGKKALARRGGLRALSGFVGGNAGKAISNGNHRMSPSQNRSIGKGHDFWFRLLHRNIAINTTATIRDNA
jgi:hypothetical protein